MAKTTVTSKRRKAAKRKAKPKPVAPLECQVDGCRRELPLGTAPLETPAGAVWLCGRCGELARVNLRQAELRAEALNVAAAPGERAIAQRNLRKAEKVQRQFGNATLLG